jgi:hypothetical protein
VDRRTALTASLALPLGLLGCQERSVSAEGPARVALPKGAGDLSRIARVLTATPTREGQGAVVRRLFPSPGLRHLDPFVLLDDFSVREPAGFPRHPHRGFEALTYMLEGAFHHQDNLGNDSVVGRGGAQRFTSGRGAYHSEMPSGRDDNRGMQLWINLPRRQKAMAPSYAASEARDLPEESVGGGFAREIVGARSPTVLETPVDYLELSLEAGAHFSRAVAPGWNALVYVVTGVVSLLGQRLGEGQAALPTSGVVELSATTDARLVFLAGLPHGEPILQRGPFVD